ncbi:MAG: L-histidine N(alpha)-methyltransferase [Acidobacteriota bacterium]|nr:L-histidine N(alpha)-methyltransferase [Acidobacteriota bacterium]MDH3528800.1 L-histidine N(alpha)-methyltransferase [Acidobacteriota bacterium]
MNNSTKSQTDSFARDVLEGLSASPKKLSSKYFYDDEGSRLFVEIMKLPEYYLSRSELEIFRDRAAEIYAAFGEFDEPFDLLELGAGDGSKTSLLVAHFLEEGSDFRYIPVDISSEALNYLESKFDDEFPGLEISSIKGDYFQTLETLSARSKRRKIVLFLGSNVGNFSDEQAVKFFRDLRGTLNEGDLLFIGFDLHKNPQTILNAYNDAQGITSRFNLNLLRRINRELGANFNLDEFLHYASYHPIEKTARSFLISQREQTVDIEALNKSFEFGQWEPIFMEISQKYDLETIQSMASSSGYEIVGNFFDSHGFYVDSLWKPTPA